MANKTIQPLFSASKIQPLDIDVWKAIRFSQRLWNNNNRCPHCYPHGAIIIALKQKTFAWVLVGGGGATKNERHFPSRCCGTTHNINKHETKKCHGMYMYTRLLFCIMPLNHIALDSGGVYNVHFLCDGYDNASKQQAAWLCIASYIRQRIWFHQTLLYRFVLLAMSVICKQYWSIYSWPDDVWIGWIVVIGIASEIYFAYKRIAFRKCSKTSKEADCSHSTEWNFATT